MGKVSPQVVDRVVIRFAGDSGDGMQLIGTQFTNTAALLGNDVATFPDYPAEIRAPAGTQAGVSGFQVHFSNSDIYTPGDKCDALIAMNAAALIKNLVNLKLGGTIIVNTDKMTERDLTKADATSNPLEDGSLDRFRVVPAPIGQLTRAAVAEHGVKGKDAERCKNFFSLGMAYWLYGRSMETTEGWIKGKFKSPYKEANLSALHAGHIYAQNVDLFQSTYEVAPATDMKAGQYRNLTGNHTTALGLVAAALKAGRPLFYGSYPITPATDILHYLAKFKNFGITTFQAEDEIAGICSAIGASYGGSLGVTGTSGPGLALKGEALGLAMMVELPLVVVNVQRGGPSTGLPTKTEQSDLMQVMYGRNGESPVPVIAASTPSDCFEAAFEAVRIAVKYMTPVILLTDGYIANGAEPWCLPALESIPEIPVKFATDPESYMPYKRDPTTLAREWAVPGTPGLEHRLGGLEKDLLTGNVSYVPENHHKMCELRAEKVQRIQAEIPPVKPHGSEGGVLVLGWGSTYGAIRTAVEQHVKAGHAVAHVHLRHINPFPADLGEVLRRYDRVLVPELNLGQLVKMIRSEFLVDARPVSKVQGQPFYVEELFDVINAAVIEVGQ